MKCYNCGHEFEGKFCPECGAQAIELPQKCPNCGKERQGEEKFCTECGFSFIPKQTDNNSIRQKPTLKLAALYRALPVIPTYAFAVYSLFTFIFFCAPAANLFRVSFNVYNLLDNSAAFIVLLILAILGFLFAAFAICTLFIPKLKFKSFNFKNLTFTLNNLNAVLSCLILLIYFILCCVICGIVSSWNYFNVGACPILIMIFSLLLIILTIGTFVVQHYLDKRHPEFKAEAESNYYKQYAAYLNNVGQMQSDFAAQGEPVAPDPVKEPVKPPMSEEEKTVAKYERFKIRSLCYFCLPTFLIGILSSIISCFFAKYRPSDWNPNTKIRGKGLKIITITGAILTIAFLLLFVVSLHLCYVEHGFGFSDLMFDFWDHICNIFNAKDEAISFDMTTSEYLHQALIENKIGNTIICFLFFLYQAIWLIVVSLCASKYRKKLNIMFYGEKKPAKSSTHILQYCDINKEYFEQLAAYKSYIKEQKIYLEHKRLYDLYIKNLNASDNNSPDN